MKLLLSVAVLMLMVSIGMNLQPRQLRENASRLTPELWGRLLAATFLIPPLLALALGRLLHLTHATTAGLFLIGVAPGAPLMTRGVAKKGFDFQLAASYQLWGALLIPLLIPLLTAIAGRLHGREIWVPPLKLLRVVVQQQFIPLLLGMALRWWAPAFSLRVQRGLNVAGNALLIVVLAGLLYQMGPALRRVSPMVAVGALLLAVGCLVTVLVVMGTRSSEVQTLAMSNTNRHVGLALLLAGQHAHDQRTVPSIAAYAFAAVLVMTLYARFAPRYDSSRVESVVPE